jgi:oxygen-dependent protoporphyrinogen oxidase
MPHVTIIGGGIAGLSTAFYLEQQSQEAGKSVTYTVIDSEPHFGGKIVTSKVDDFVIEGGPDSFITMKPWGTQLCQDLGLADQIIPTNDRQNSVFVLNKGRLTPFPGGFRLTIPTQFVPFALTPLISPLGKARMGLDLFIPPRQENSDESLGSFIRRRLGQEAVDKFGGPIMAGIYVADPEQLSLQSTFPQFSEMERKHGSLIKAMRYAKRSRPQHSSPSNNRPRAMFTSLQGGMGELVDTLVSRLTGELRSDSRVVDLRYRSPGFEVTLDTPHNHSFETDAVVLALPAYAAAKLVDSIEPQLAEMLTRIRYVSTATISLGYRLSEVTSQHDFNGFGFVIPKSENRQILACTWSSTKFGHRAPAGNVLLRAFVGGAEHGHLVTLPDDDLVALVQAELFRWVDGNPQYDVGHLDRVTEMEAQAQHIPGLYLTGSAYRGIGIPDCVKSAQATVKQLLTHLG